ncbi:MAG: FAD-binding oxidoreductase, partial [Firmicutes bacterium]|nr:FAD-binding oxidoreductase [Bacillota bacterium]
MSPNEYLVDTRKGDQMIHTDVLIIGAGVSGLSIAFHLADLAPQLKITVVEKEKFPGLGSTAHCTGGIRHQFSSTVNVQMTMLSLPCFKKFAREMGYPVYFRQQGYLFTTAREETFAGLKGMASLLESLQVPVEILSPGDIAVRYPYIQSADLAGGTFCPLDGYADPHGVVQGYFKEARRRGVQVLCEEKVLSITVSGGRVKGAVTGRREFEAGAVVNAAGPHLAEIAALAGITLPARPYRRQVYVCTP